jgi:hypothetical protein
MRINFIAYVRRRCCIKYITLVAFNDPQHTSTSRDIMFVALTIHHSVHDYYKLFFPMKQLQLLS